MCLLLHCKHTWSSTCIFEEETHVVLLRANVSRRIEGTKLNLGARHLNLRWKYSSIETDAFLGLGNLRVLILKGNNLKYLDAELFKDLKSLKE